MQRKNDPNKSVISVLKKYKLADMLQNVSSWLDSEPGSPGALKKFFISNLTGVDYDNILLKDPVTWGDVADGDMPEDQFFLELFKAIKTDEKRNASRSSYEF